jgi:hypothetical protein
LNFKTLAKMKFLIFVLISISIKEIQSGGPSSSSRPARMLPSVCDSVLSVDITHWGSAPNRIYDKTACYISQNLTYSQAVAFCEANEMILLTIPITIPFIPEMSEVSTYVTHTLRLTQDQYVWVNGQKLENGTWVSKPGNILVNTEQTYSWLPKADKSHDCLLFSMNKGIVFGTIENPAIPFGFDTVDCTSHSTFYCDFYKF